MMLSDLELTDQIASPDPEFSHYSAILSIYVAILSYNSTWKMASN